MPLSSLELAQEEAQSPHWTRDEVKAVLGHLTGDKWLMASLLYGSGLRLMECLRLRVQDIDFAANQITVRDGKGQQDRITLLSQVVKHL